jgi:hypothetical protein
MQPIETLRLCRGERSLNWNIQFEYIEASSAKNYIRHPNLDFNFALA